MAGWSGDLPSPLMAIFIPCHNGSVLWYHIGRPCVCPSIRLLYVCPYFRFRTITFGDVSGFSPNFVLWRSGFGLLMGNFFLLFIYPQHNNDLVLSFQVFIYIELYHNYQIYIWGLIKYYKVCLTTLRWV